jgi:hypothetical protein
MRKAGRALHHNTASLENQRVVLCRTALAGVHQVLRAGRTNPHFTNSSNRQTMLEVVDRRLLAIREPRFGGASHHSHKSHRNGGRLFTLLRCLGAADYPFLMSPKR